MSVWSFHSCARVRLLLCTCVGLRLRVRIGGNPRDNARRRTWAWIGQRVGRRWVLVPSAIGGGGGTDRGSFRRLETIRRRSDAEHRPYSGLGDREADPEVISCCMRSSRAISWPLGASGQLCHRVRLRIRQGAYLERCPAGASESDSATRSGHPQEALEHALWVRAFGVYLARCLHLSPPNAPHHTTPPSPHDSHESSYHNTQPPPWLPEPHAHPAHATSHPTPQPSP